MLPGVQAPPTGMMAPMADEDEATLEMLVGVVVAVRVCAEAEDAIVIRVRVV